MLNWIWSSRIGHAGRVGKVQKSLRLRKARPRESAAELGAKIR